LTHRDFFALTLFLLILFVSNVIVILRYISITDAISELCDEKQFIYEKLED